MVNNTVDQHRNASASWSGYIHQGKVGFLVSLRELKKRIQEKASNYEKYQIRYENAEDFDIVNDDKVISRHQVKAYKDGEEREKYSTLFYIQTRNIEDGKILKEGFQIHKFDEDGKILEVEVNEDSRYVHTITDVPDFYLSEASYLKKYSRRSKYTKNESKIKLYPYSELHSFCPLSVNKDNDMVKMYCIKEIEEILILLENPLKENSAHAEQVYFKYVASILDNSIGTAHTISTHPTITFKEILNLLITDISEDDIYKAKNNFIYAWDEYKKDFEETLPVETMQQMNSIVKNLLQKRKKNFEEIVRKLAPHEEIDKPISHILDGTVSKNILFCLFEELNEFDCGTITYLDKVKDSYRVSLITARNKRAKIAKIIEHIINNKEFLNKSFDNRYLINEKISGISLNDSVNDSPEANSLINYKEEWNTGIADNIFNIDMEFIDIETAIDNLKEK